MSKFFCKNPHQVLLTIKMQRSNLSLRMHEIIMDFLTRFFLKLKSVLKTTGCFNYPIVWEQKHIEEATFYRQFTLFPRKSAVCSTLRSAVPCFLPAPSSDWLSRTHVVLRLIILYAVQKVSVAFGSKSAFKPSDERCQNICCRRLHD